MGALWQSSLAAKEERVACLASSIRNDTVFVTAVAPLEPEGADSMGISATRSVEECGPPRWSGTVHTHIALYTDDLPSTRFSGQDRIAMRLWYDRWHSDGVFCLIYSVRDAHCEADGVVGGLRRRLAGRREGGKAGRRGDADASLFDPQSQSVPPSLVLPTALR